MFALFRDKISARKALPPPTVLEALAFIRQQVEAKNVPVVADDVDAGYDMAIDEVLDIISDYEKALKRAGMAR